MRADHILMQVPATTQAGPTVRLAAVQLAAQCEFDHDRIIDVQIAVSEALRLLLGASDAARGADMGRLAARFTVGARSLTLALGFAGDTESATPGAEAGHDPVDRDESDRIFAATTTSYAIREDAPVTVTVRFGEEASTGAAVD